MRDGLGLYASGDFLVYRHKGHAYVGELVKAQRRAAVLKGSRGGKEFTVPWNAVDGLAPRKDKPGPVKA